MNIVDFYIVSCGMTFMMAVVLIKMLMKDMNANRERDKYLCDNPEFQIMIYCFIPIFNIILIFAMAYMAYSYHQYTLGNTDYNIFEEEGEF
jgi:hypothetical protein